MSSGRGSLVSFVSFVSLMSFVSFVSFMSPGVWELRAVVHGAWCMVHGSNAPVLRCRSVLRSELALSESEGFCVHQRPNNQQQAQQSPP